MMNQKDLLVHQQRQHDLQREAERLRLMRSLRRQAASGSRRTPRALSRLIALFL